MAERKHRYRRLLLALLVIALAGAGIWGYRYLKRSVPDQIYVDRGNRAGIRIPHRPSADHIFG